jgi:hypothetical protein
MAKIVQLSTANTFGQWVTTTQELVSKVNDLTDGGNTLTFFANTNLEVGNDLTVGGDLTVTGNIILDNIGFNDLFVSGNVVIDEDLSVIGDTLLTELEVTGNIVTLNTTTNAFIGEDLFVYGNTNVSGSSLVDNLTVNANASFSQVDITGNVSTLNVTNEIYVGGDTFISGNLVVSGNVTLDAMGFDDLDVAGSGTFGNNLTVIGTSEFTGNAEFINAEVTGTLTAEVFAGNANTAIYNTIASAQAAAEGSALAFAIALG